MQPAILLNLPLGLSELDVRSHVLAPAHVRNIQIEEVDEAREVRYAVPPVVRPIGRSPHVDLAAFGLAINTILKDIVAGYMLQIRQNGNLVHVGIWNWAQTPADQAKGWDEDTRMHLASVSKFLTAVALVKALDSKGISYDAKIVGYLPAYWSKGSNIGKITFRHLLTHKSGFQINSSASDYAFMKARVAAGVTNVGVNYYQNMNYGLCRILIPVIVGNISKTAEFVNDADLNDKTWDAVTLLHYRNYLQAKVFTPAGVTNAGFAPVTGGKRALAYPFPFANKKGWNSADLATVAGGAGWRLSTKELLSVMNHVRRKNTIIAPEKAQYMLDNYFGIDQAIDTPAGKIYNKNGAWGTGDGRTEQCVAYFWPKDMELALFVNSPIGSSNYSLRKIVQDVFVNSMSG